MKWLLYIIIGLAIISSVLATEEVILGQNVTLPCLVTLNGIPFAANGTNITIYSPNGAVLIQSFPTKEITEGRFHYVYEPNQTGIHSYECDFYNSTSYIGTASDTLFVFEGDNMESVAMVLGLLGIIGTFLILAFNVKFQNIPFTRIIEKVLYISLAMIFVLILVFFMYGSTKIYNSLNSFTSLFGGIFEIMIYLMLGFMFFLFIYYFTSFFKELNKRKKEKQEKEDGKDYSF